MALFGKDILALDWDHRQVRAVSARVSGGRVSVRRMFEEPVPGEVTLEDPVSLGQWLAGVLARHHCAGQRTLVAIPRDQVVLKDLLLPAQTPELEIAALVQFQMQKELPFGSDEAVIDYTVAARSVRLAGPPPGGAGEAGAAGDNALPAGPPSLEQNELLVAATRREVIEYFKQVAQAAHLNLARIGLRCFNNLQAVRACAPSDANRRLLLVNVGPELTEIDVIRGGGLVFSRSASVPVNEQEDSGEFLNRLTLEVVRSVQAARATVADLELDGVVVAAPAWLAAGIADRLGQRLDVRAWVLEPGRTIALPAEHRQGAGEFSAALGMVLGEGAKGPDHAALDFLHPHRPVDLVALRQRKRRTVAAAIGLTAITLLVGNRVALAIKDADLEEKQKRVNKFKAEAAAVTRLGESIEWLKRYEAGSPVWLGEFRKINETWMSNWHQNAYVSIEFTGRMEKDAAEVSLKGVAKTAGVVDAITEKLRAIYPKLQVEGKVTNVYPGQEYSQGFTVTIVLPPPSPGKGAGTQPAGQAESAAGGKRPAK